MVTETAKDNSNTSVHDGKCGYSTYSYSPPPKRPPPSDAHKAAQDIRTAKAALEYYNNKNDVKFELVEPIASTGKLRIGGIWYHCNFRAKQEGQDSSLAKVFFAELNVVKFDHKSGTAKYLCTACRPLDGKTSGSCEMCGDNAMLHPTTTFRQGRYQFKTRDLRPRSDGKVLPESKRAKVAARVPFGPSFHPTSR